MKANFPRAADIRAVRSLYQFVPDCWTILPTGADVPTATLRDTLDLGHRERTDDLADFRMHAEQTSLARIRKGAVPQQYQRSACQLNG
jgi:hypothetical protein